MKNINHGSTVKFIWRAGLSVPELLSLSLFDNMHHCFFPAISLARKIVLANCSLFPLSDPNNDKILISVPYL